MPNDPRIKFKKKVYDPSRNLMYEERTGGGGGSFPSGGGGGGGGGGNIPWTPIGPSNPVDPVKPVNPFDPFGPFTPAIVPFDPYQRRQKSRLEDFMRRDAQDYYNRSQIRPKIATPKMFDNDVAPSALPNVDILVDVPPAPAPSTLPGPSSRLLAGAKPTAISGITGKLPPRIDIKPANLLDPTAPAKIPRVLIGPDQINPDLQGTTRAQIDALEAKRLREEGKTTIDATTPLEQDIAAKMHEMRYAGATDAEMVKVANDMRKIDAAGRANRPIDFVDSKGKSLADSPDTPERYNIEQEIAEGREALKDPLLSKEEAEGYKEIIADLEEQLKTLEKQKATKTLKETAQKLKLGEKPSLGKRLFDMFKGKPKPQGIADLKKELRLGVADASLEEQLKLHEREAVNPSNTPEQIEAVKQNIADIKKEIIAEQMAKVDATAKAASSKPGIGENFEAQKIDLEGKISKINDKISKSKSVTEKAQLGKQKQQYQQRIKAIERNLAIRDKAMGDIQKVQKIADTAKQFIESGGTSKPAPAPARTPYKEKAPPMSTDAERLKLARKALQEINEDIKNKGGFKDIFGNRVDRTPQEIENLKKTKANIERIIGDLETKLGGTIQERQAAAQRGGRPIDEGAGLGIGSGREALGMSDEEFANTLEQAGIQAEREIPVALDPKNSETLARTRQMYEYMRESDAATAPAPAPRPVRDVAPGERPPLNETFRTPDPAVKAVTTPDYLQIEKPKLDFAKMFERTENLLEQAKAHRARVTSPEEIAQLDRLELTLERALRELGNENPDAYNKAFAPVDLAEEIAETKSLLTTIDEEITNAKTPKEVAKLKKVKDKVERTLRDLKRGKTELYDTGTGKGLSEVSIREFGEEMPTTSKIAERLQKIRIADENIGSFLDLPKPPEGGPEPSPPASPPETELMETTPASRQGLMERLSKANYERVDILDTIDELEGTPSRGGRVSLEEPIEIGDLGGTPSRGGRVSTTEISPPSSGSTTPSSESSGTRTPIEIDTSGPSTGPARPAPGRGRAKIEPVAPKGIKKPVGSTPKRIFGRDLNIQAQGQSVSVSSQFMNKPAAKFGASLRALNERVPTLRAPSAATLKQIGMEGGKTIAGLVIGIGVSYLMAKYFKEHPATDKYSQIGQEFAVSFSGAAAGNLVMRAIGIAGRLGMKTFTRAGAQLAAKEALYATGEAAAFVAVQMAVEMSIETIMDNYKFSHAASKTTAAFTGGALGAGIGFKQGGYAGLALMTAFAAYSTTQAYFEGKEMDEAEAAGRKTSAEITVSVNNARRQLVKNMAQTNNNYDEAYALLRPSQRRDLALVGDDAQDLFKNSLLREFDPLSKERYGNPFVPPEVEPEHDKVKEGLMMSMEGNLLSLGLNYLTSIDPAGGGALSGYEMYQQDVVYKENKLKDQYYQEYVEWYMNKISTAFYNVPQPSGPGLELLERDTGGSWRSSAEFSAELVYQQNLHYTAVVNKAREQVLDEWHSNMVTMGEMTNRDIVDMANLGGNFADQYDKYIVTNATAQLAALFNENGTNYRDAPERLTAVASRDPTVLPALDHYYEVMTQLSKDTELPIAELARLNALPEVEQGRELGKINALRERVIRTGLQSDKAAVDEFNAGLIRDMQSYGDNFEAIMININQQQMLMGYSYLYGTNKTDFYRQLHLEAPVIVIPPNPYAGSTQFDYEKNRTPGDTAIYGYRYNLTDEQNQELEDYLYYKNRELYQAGDTKGRLTTADAMAKAAEIYDRDISIYRKSDEEVAKENNMTLTEYYAEYGYDMDKKPPVEPIEWKDITERDQPPPASSNANIESDDRAAERQANADMEQARIAAGDTGEIADQMAAGAYDASQRALVDAQGGNNIAGDQPQPRTDSAGQIIREENDPDGP